MLGLDCLNFYYYYKVTSPLDADHLWAEIVNPIMQPYGILDENYCFSLAMFSQVVGNRDIECIPVFLFDADVADYKMETVTKNKRNVCSDACLGFCAVIIQIMYLVVNLNLLFALASSYIVEMNLFTMLSLKFLDSMQQIF